MKLGDEFRGYIRDRVDETKEFTKNWIDWVDRFYSVHDGETLDVPQYNLGYF